MTCNLLIMNEVNLQENDKTFNDFIRNKLCTELKKRAKILILGLLCINYTNYA